MKPKLTIVITLSSSHVHYCKALVASINYFNPDLPIIILKDGVFDTSFFEKDDYISIVDSIEINKIHGLDLYILLNKLNILYLPEFGFSYDYYLHLDADSVLTNKIDEDFFIENKDFYMLQGNIIDRNDNRNLKLISQYAFNPNDFPEYKFDLDQLYLFSASHIAISKAITPLLIDYLKIHRFELNKIFLNDKRIRFNDQGFFNLMVNYLSFTNKMTVKLVDCGIYGYESPRDYPLLTLEKIKEKKNTNVLFIHYTGSSRHSKLKNHLYGNILVYFSKLFYNDNINYHVFEFKRVSKWHYDWFMKRAKFKIKHLKKKWSKK